MVQIQDSLQSRYLSSDLYFVEVMECGLSLCDGASTQVANVAVAPLNIELGVAHHMVRAQQLSQDEASLRDVGPVPYSSLASIQLLQTTFFQLTSHHNVRW